MKLNDQTLQTYGRQLDMFSYMAKTGARIDECLAILPPTDDKQLLICIGLLAKLRKLHASICRNIKEADQTTVSILIRVYFECVLSLQFLFSRNNTANLTEFIKSDVLSRKQMLTDIEKFSHYTDEEKAMLIAALERTITEDGFDPAALKPQRMKGSWHSSYTFYQMATMVGKNTEAIFREIYGPTSTSVHPTWTDIKNHHLKRDDTDPNLFVPDTTTSSQIFLEMSTLYCLTFAATGAYAAFFGNDGKLAAQIEKEHAAFHAMTKGQSTYNLVDTVEQ